jgi:hypothetical protein
VTDNGQAEGVARELRRRGLSTPALLEAHRPIRPLLSDASTFLGPLLAPLFGRHVGAIDTTLASDEAYDGLLERLEAEEPDAEHR